jgi:demethylmenaquinone methyltransferase / 2-methoxy-6-polyprenyl-1,4-benzoquinol methylase
MGGAAMFDRIAKRYDLLNRILSFGMDQRWRRRLVASLGHQLDSVLDVATGTADVAIAAAKRFCGSRVVGLDPSDAMLAIGQRKIDRLGLNKSVTLIRGDALALPFPDRSFGACCMSFGMRNLVDRPRALAEMVRVTRRGGIVAVLEFSWPRGRLCSNAAGWYVRWLLPKIGAWLADGPAYRHLAKSIEAFPTPDVFVAMMCAAGLHGVTHRSWLFGTDHLFVGRVGPEFAGQQAPFPSRN